MSFIGNNPKLNTLTYNGLSARPSNPVEGMVYYDDGTTNTEGLWKYQNAVWEFVGDLVDYKKLIPQAADPGSPVEGQVFYSDGTARAEGLWVYDGANWQAVGSTVSDKAVYAQFDAEDKSVTGFTNITITTSSPINEENSYSVDSYPATLPVVTLQARNKDKTNAVEVHYTMTSGTAKLLVKDNSAATLDEINITSSSAPQKVILQPSITSSMTTVQLSIEDVSSATGLKIDDIIFSDDPFVFKNLIVQGSGRWDVSAGNASTNTRIMYYTNERVNDLSEIGIVSNSSTEGWSFTANKRCSVTLSVTSNFNAAGTFGISLNSNQLTTNLTGITQEHRVATASSASANDSEVAVFSGVLEVGDVLRPHDDGNTVGIGGRSGLTIEAVAETEHVITPATSNVNNFSARIANSGSASVVSQGGKNDEGQNAIASVNRTGTGVVDITFTVGFFTDIPAIVSTVEDSLNGAVEIEAPSTTGVTIKTTRTTDGVAQDVDFIVQIDRQENDVRNSSFIAALPFDTVIGTNVLSSNLTTTTADIASLRFENLIIGDVYEVKMQSEMNTQNDSAAGNLTARHNGANLIKLNTDREFGGGGATAAETQGTSIIFKAAATTLTFDFNASGSAQLTTDATTGSTFTQLIHKPMTKVS